jgi:hypothetical protein
MRKQHLKRNIRKNTVGAKTMNIFSHMMMMMMMMMIVMIITNLYGNDHT